MSFAPEFSPEIFWWIRMGGLEAGFDYRLVGWLGNRVRSRGETDPAVLEQLERLKRRNALPDGCMGYYGCKICIRERQKAEISATGGGNPFEGLGERGGIAKNQFFIEAGRVRYVLPNMVTHYIAVHGYKLPPEVEAAVRESPDS